jgi:hypothetical protein
MPGSSKRYVCKKRVFSLPLAAATKYTHNTSANLGFLRLNINQGMECDPVLFPLSDVELGHTQEFGVRGRMFY